MNHQPWPPNYVVAWALWIIGTCIIALDLFVSSADDIGHIGIAFLLVGKIFHDREMNWCLRHRERAAFDLGHEAGLRSIR